MNYYEHHLGDYAKDTGHLSMLEHGAYRLLLDRYYSTEEGIPAAQAYRLARARSNEECQAVDVVLEEFFELVDGVWINHRAEEEIDGARRRIGAAKENGKKGGRPKKHSSGYENETQQKPTGFPLGYENETQQKAHQTPDTNHQTPVVLNDDSGDVTTTGEINPPPSSSDPIQPRAIELTVMLRQRGAALQAADPHVRQWAGSGVTDAQALTALDTAKQQRASKGDISPINSGYLNAILQNQLNPQAKARASPPRSPATQMQDERLRIAREITEAAKNGRNREIDITGSAVVVDGQAVRTDGVDVRPALVGHVGRA